MLNEMSLQFSIFSCDSKSTTGVVLCSKGLGVHCRAPGASRL